MHTASTAVKRADTCMCATPDRPEVLQAPAFPRGLSGGALAGRRSPAQLHRTGRAQHRRRLPLGLSWTEGNHMLI